MTSADVHQPEECESGSKAEILAVASYVRQQCQEQTEKPTESLAVPSLCLSLSTVKQLMETVKQAATGYSNSTGSTGSTSTMLKSLLSDTKKIASIVQRMVKLHPVLQLIEGPTILQDLTKAMGKLYSTLHVLQSVVHVAQTAVTCRNWKQMQAKLEFLVEKATYDKAQLLHTCTGSTTTTPCSPVLQTCLQETTTSTGSNGKPSKDLLKVLQRHKRKLCQKAMDETKEESKRERAKALVEYLDKLLDKLANADNDNNDRKQTRVSEAAGELPSFGSPGKVSLLEDELGPSAHPTNYKSMLLLFSNSKNEGNANANDNDLRVSVSTMGFSDGDDDGNDAILGQENPYPEEEEVTDDYEVPIQDNLGQDSTGITRTRKPSAQQSLDEMFNSALNRQTTTDTQMTEVVDNRALIQQTRPKLRPLDRSTMTQLKTRTACTMDDDSVDTLHRKQAWKTAAKAKQQLHEDASLMDDSSSGGVLGSKMDEGDAHPSNDKSNDKSSTRRKHTRGLSPFRTKAKPQPADTSYPMVDHADTDTGKINLQKSKPKNPVKKLFKMLKGGNVHSKEQEKGDTLRVSVNQQKDQNRALKMSTSGKVPLTNASVNTAMTASMNTALSLADHHRDERYSQMTSQCASNNSTLPSGSGHSITIAGTRVEPTRNRNTNKKCMDAPPPLVPMTGDGNTVFLEGKNRAE
ncbi:unknown protein [Seminavis robusta]|uniref:Uncharacterized protein n=1 Tax=Seminavis robusta TaxID=568900 RepID=A0A9N8H6B5_9STRA|nr:unknown protein [Seminavis robusta]|eukprot:Sro95_g049290.1 n/a (690) ;mRNA; r:59448-61517